MANVAVPNDNRVSQFSDMRFSEVWTKFFAAVARKLNAGAAVPAVTTANASDLATAIALVNDLKTKVNSLIGAQGA